MRVMGHVRLSMSAQADEVYVEAIVIRRGANRAAIVTGDFLCLTPAITQAVDWAAANSSATKDARRDRWSTRLIYFGASHTHSSVGSIGGNLLEQAGFGPASVDTIVEFGRRIVKAIESADQRLQPCKISWHTATTEPILIRNRTKPDDITQRELEHIRFVDAQSGTPIVNLISFSAHATCRPASDLCISGDYPSALRAQLEADAKFGKVVFLAGAVGSMGPGEASALGVTRADLPATLASKLAEVLRNTERELISIRSSTLQIDQCHLELPASRIRLSQHWSLSPILSSTLVNTRAKIVTLTLGEIKLLGMPGDYSGVHASRDGMQRQQVVAGSSARQQTLALNLTNIRSSRASTAVPRLSFASRLLPA